MVERSKAQDFEVLRNYEKHESDSSLGAAVMGIWGILNVVRVRNILLDCEYESGC